MVERNLDPDRINSLRRPLGGARRNLGPDGRWPEGSFRADGAGIGEAVAFVDHSRTAPNSDAEADETTVSGSIQRGSSCETPGAEQCWASADANAGRSRLLHEVTL